MALISECQRCHEKRVICCHDCCYKCLDLHNDIDHLPNCRVTTVREIERKKSVDQIHNLIGQKTQIIAETGEIIESMQIALRKMDPCPKCKGHPNMSRCPICHSSGYNTRPTEEELNQEPPPKTC